MLRSLPPMKKPFLHFTAPKNWLNDPNGLVYHNGIYHLFYQHNPHDVGWGQIHWGHAVSNDCLNWENRDIAIAPDNTLIHIFSGCGVIDKENTSGFFKDSEGIILIFTGVSIDSDSKEEIEHQYIGYIDEDTNQVILPENNLILKNPGYKNFRDPTVIYNFETELWLMTLTCGDHISFYSSPDLKNWSLEEKFFPENLKENEIIECPNLFPLLDEVKKIIWILSFCIQNTISKNSATYYSTGQLKNNNFESVTNQFFYADYGHDFYAPQIWFQSSKTAEEVANKALWIGWMNNWAYANSFPNIIWNGIMSISRQLSIKTVDGIPLLSQQPISEINSLRKKQISPIFGKKSLSLNFPKPAIYDINLKLHSSLSKIIKINLSEDNKQEFTININLKNGKIDFNRQKTSFSGMKDKNLIKKSFQFIPPKEFIDIRLIIDLWTLEFFLFKGSIVISEIVNWHNFPETLVINGENLDSTTIDFSCWELQMNLQTVHKNLNSKQIRSKGSA